MKHRRSAFTFVEIMVVIALIGVMATCAIAPMVYMVSNIRDARTSFGEESTVRVVFALLSRDIRNVLVVPNKSYMLVKKRDLFGGKSNDILAIASGSLIKNALVPGVIVYGIIREDFLESKSVLPGLYRWILPVKGIEEVDFESGLSYERGALVLPYVDSFRVETYVGKSWIGDYSGPMPIAVKFILERGGVNYKSTDWFPAL